MERWKDAEGTLWSHGQMEASKFFSSFVLLHPEAPGASDGSAFLQQPRPRRRGAREKAVSSSRARFIIRISITPKVAEKNCFSKTSPAVRNSPFILGIYNNNFFQPVYLARD